MVHLPTIVLLHLLRVEERDNYLQHLLLPDGECLLRGVQLHRGVLCTL